jgi:hypothetical protein
MTPGKHGEAPRSGTIGRGFAFMDPERRCEVAGTISVLRTEPRVPARPGASRLERLRPQRGDGGMDEGGSSRHSR